MKFNREKFILWGLLIGMILGGLVGVYAEGIASDFAFLGTLFLNALKLIIVPLIVASMISGVTSLGDVRKLGKLGATTIVYYLATTAISVIIGIIVVNLIQPGVGGAIDAAATAPQAGQYSILDVILGMFPPNIIAAAARTDVMPLIVFSLVFGAVLTTVGAKAEPVIHFFDVINEVILKIVGYFMLFAPFGVFGLIAGKLGEVGWGAFQGELIKTAEYSLTVLLGLALHGVVVLPAILYFLAGRKPIKYLRHTVEAVVTAFSTASSSATLPVTMEAVEKNAKISNKIGGFVLPLGATINMDGTALYEAVAAIFIAQLYGVHLTLGTQLVIFLTAILASVGAAGIPQAGLVTMVMVLHAAGLPTEGIGSILAVDWFLDRFRTATNVWGDVIATAVIEKRLGEEAIEAIAAPASE